MGVDVSTRAGVLRFAELRRAETARQYLARGELEKTPLLYVFATHGFTFDTSRDPPLRAGPKLPQVTALSCYIPEAIEKKIPVKKRTLLLGELVRSIVKASKATGVLYVMDVWLGDAEKAPEDHHYGWIEENRDGEGLIMRLEHQALAHPLSWISVIHRDPLRLDPWRGGEQRGPDEGSRLSHWIDWTS